MSPNFGINVVGTFRAETGFGEAVRGTLSALEKADIPVKIINLSMKLENRLNDESVTDFAEENTYPVNLVQVNPFMIGRLLKNKEAGFFEGKYNIAYWVWETSEVPDEFLEFAYLFDEIWTASEYCQKAIAQKAAIPVLCIPHVAEISTDAIAPALPIALDESKFIFFNVFDFGSLIERKNTLGLIEAFKKAFSKDDSSVQLLIKSSTGFEFPTEKQSVEDAIAEYPNITLLDTMFRRNELLALINRADCYVSLHRSEGFGLNMADAMAIGKPVIATGYSGNMEFMNVNNSLPVKYALKEITYKIPPYSIGSIWSEPDTDHAASLMKYAVDNPDEIKQLGKRAQQDMAHEFSAEAIARLIQKRLPVITNKINSDNEDLAAKLDLANAKTYVLEEKVKYLEKTWFNKIRKKLKKR